MRASELRGTTRLAVDAAIEATHLVETVHRRVLDASTGGCATVHAPMLGLTRLVYSSVRAITTAAGAGVDFLLGALSPVVDEATRSSKAPVVSVAVLNGILGHHLEFSGNPLRLPMRAHHDVAALQIDGTDLPPGDPPVRRRLMLLVHGLCLGPSHWARGGEDRAAALARALGYTPLHLEYNSGLHVSDNGRTLAALLDELTAAWPVTVDELVILGHSMGGLVARSALHYGALAGHAWRRAKLTVVFLGTPHHGAPLERHGHQIDRLFRVNAFTAPFERVGRMRSPGITDLRHGNVVEEDWNEHCRFAHAHDTRRALPLPPDVRCFAIAGSRADGEIAPGARVVGDGLVPVASALGHHRDPARELGIAPSHQWIARATNHLDLLSSPAVFSRIAEWLEGDIIR